MLDLDGHDDDGHDDTIAKRVVITRSDVAYSVGWRMVGILW